jgi:phosphonate ABC transporter permease subunit PhnE
MAEYFTSRGLPVPRELQQNPLTDWRRLALIVAVLLVLYIGFQITSIDTGRANPEYVINRIALLFQWDFSIMSPRDEFETYQNTAWWKMIETIFLGIMATALSMVVALPLSFLAARNIMTGNPVSAAIYAVVRVVFTIMRSIDVLIVVIVLIGIFGPGSAAGVFGLAFHNIGVMGKLYSEAIEGIDAGPLEAITATGGNRLQVIWAAVLPQITNPFIAFTIYRLDTNVRLAPILGLVGGGGIGLDLFQAIQISRYGAAGLIIFMIVFTVAAMDFISAQIRKRLV